MIKVAGTQKMVRQTTAQFEYPDEKGNIQTEEIVVRYFVQSGKVAKEKHEAARVSLERAKQNDELPPFEYYVDTLAERLESLPDLCDGQGKAFAITPENLGMLSTSNLDSINKAIQEHQVPKEQPQRSQDGTNAATNPKGA